MAADSIQTQRGGDNSHNVQIAKVVVEGLSYKDVRDLALDVFRQNFEALSAKAAEIARTRAEELTDKFLRELEKQNPTGVAQGEDPDFQLGLFTAQKEYARTGDPALAEILVDVLVQRSKQPRRNVLQITLTESLTVVPKLTLDQLAALAVAFYVRSTKQLGVQSATDIMRNVAMNLAPFLSELSKKPSGYQHLEFASCVTIGLGRALPNGVLKATYGNAFSKGIEPELVETQYPELLARGNILSRSDAAPGRLFFRMDFADNFDAELEKLGFTAERAAAVKNAWNATLMNEDEVREYTERLWPPMKEVNEFFRDSLLGRIQLTTVGIAIGHSYLKAKVPSMNADLSIWIN